MHQNALNASTQPLSPCAPLDPGKNPIYSIFHFFIFSFFHFFSHFHLNFFLGKLHPPPQTT